VSESNVIKLAQPGAFTDSLTEILRSGARALLSQAVEAEVAEFLAKHAGLQTETGQRPVVRHGHLPEREIMTGIGPVAVRQPRVRDRAAAESERIRYSPSIRYSGADGTKTQNHQLFTSFSFFFDGSFVDWVGAFGSSACRATPSP